MVKLPNSLRDWQTDAFEPSLKAEIERFRRDVLPLNEVIEADNRVDDSDLGMTFIRATDDEHFIKALVGIYFAEIISCCSCSGGSPVEEAYCEMHVTIDKSTGETEFRVGEDYRRE